MVRQQREGGLEIEQIGDVTVAKFTTPHLLDGERIQVLAKQLRSLGEQVGHGPVVLNFGAVERLSTEMLGKLIALQRSVQKKGGRLALCGIHPQVYEIFKIVKLPQVLPIFTDEQEALQQF